MCLTGREMGNATTTSCMYVAHALLVVFLLGKFAAYCSGGMTVGRVVKRRSRLRSPSLSLFFKALIEDSEDLLRFAPKISTET